MAENNELISAYEVDMPTGYNLKVVSVLRVLPFQMLKKLYNSIAEVKSRYNIC